MTVTGVGVGCSQVVGAGPLELLRPAAPLPVLTPPDDTGCAPLSACSQEVANSEVVATGCVKEVSIARQTVNCLTQADSGMPISGRRGCMGLLYPANTNQTGGAAGA